jgi:hypothetical protein
MNRYVTQSRWPVLSPYLDELMDLEPDARTARLAQLHQEDPALADDLQELLSRQDEMKAAAFLDRPALAGPQLEPGQLVGAARAAWARYGWRGAPTDVSTAKWRSSS